MSMFNRLFKRCRAKPGAPKLSVEAAHKVVHDYAAFLETSAPLPRCVADVNQLPYPKEYIKTAISVCAATIDVPEIIEDLKHGYLMLSAWQEDVGEQTLELDFTELNLDEDPMLVAKRIQSQCTSISRWEPLVQADQILLLAEFERLNK
jgi:hypothetical protein